MPERSRPAPRPGATGRPGGGNQIWMTPAHLGAMAVATLAIAVLSFALGHKLGKSSAAPQDPLPDQAAFLPDASDEEALEALLREVERAQAARAEAEARVGFNEELPADGPAAPRDDGPPSAAVAGLAPPADAAPAPPAAGADDDVPTSGWVVQVAAYEDPAEATAHVTRLREEHDLDAYQVAALVSGTTWHRVRIGGFDSREDADEGARDLADQLGTGELLVSVAP